MKIRTIAIAVAAAAAVGAPLAAPTAYAGGKAANNCGSGGYSLGEYVTDLNQDPPTALPGDLINLQSGVVEQRTHDALAADPPLLDGETLVSIYQSVDHNGNGDVCYKLPSGWDEGNKDSVTAFLFNLVDDKS